MENLDDLKTFYREEIQDTIKQSEKITDLQNYVEFMMKEMQEYMESLEDYNNLEEKNYESYLESYYGGSSPLTLKEKQEQAKKLK